MKPIKELENRHAPTDELIHLRNKCAELEARLSGKKATSGQVAEAMESVLLEVCHFKPEKNPVFKFCLKKPDKGSDVILAVHVTDWHVGQRTNPAHIEEFGDFGVAIAKNRVRAFAQRIIESAERLRSSFNITRCHVIGTADWNSGDIHEELWRTNEIPVPVQAVQSGYMLGGFVNALAPHFETVTVDALTAGNHDRITKKPQMEDGGLNSWGYITCAIAEESCKLLPNVKWNTHVSLSRVIEVGGMRYLIAHGDGIKGTWGIPFYGIERKKQKEAMARMNMDVSKHFDKIIIGHFHTALNHEHWMIGGSLSGTGALDHKDGRHSKPHQTSWLVHPVHGEFAWTRWWLP